MAGYRWTCNSCQKGNESNLSECAFCGCSATAGGSEIIEKFVNPEKYKKNKAKEEYKGKLTVLVYIPFFAAVYAFNGRWESLVFILAILAFSLFKNLALMSHIWSNNWARNTLFFFSGTFFFSILIRMFIIPNNSDLVEWLALFYIFYVIALNWYFFKSQRGVKFFDSYYEKANKPIKRD